jgi:uncharacterized protein involved in response to NO
MRDPLEIPFIARPHERGPRAIFYTALAVALVAAFAFEFAGHPRVGAATRAIAGSAVLLLVWKLARGPGRRDLPAFSMWGAGLFVLAGLWMLALWPSRPMAGLHVLFIGGFGLLTLAIGTRVVIAHGRHGLAAEPRVLTPVVAGGVGGALALRISAEIAAHHATLLYGWAAAAWVAAWLLWAFAAVPRMARVVPAPTPARPQPRS